MQAQAKGPAAAIYLLVDQYLAGPYRQETGEVEKVQP